MPENSDVLHGDSRSQPPIIFDFVKPAVVIVDNPAAWQRWRALVAAQMKRAAS